MRLSRRAVLGGIAAAPLVGCYSEDAGQQGPVAAPAPAPVPTPSATPTPALDPVTTDLDTLARLGNRRFGTAIASTPGNTDAGSIQNPLYADLAIAQCGIVVPESELKWQAMRPDAHSYDFSAMDDIVRWSQANGLGVRGHTLLWHRPEWFPDWLNNYDFGANPALEGERLLTEHIRMVTERYRGIITSYDVVNEAIDHGSHRPIETSLSRALGSPEAVLDLAFETTRDQLPDAQLVYNDYMSWEPDRLQHCADVLRLLEGFRQRGTPVDALGIQSHIEMLSIDPATSLGPYREKEWRTFLDEVVAMGYRLLITEFDVKDKALPADIAIRDEKVAEYARRYFEVMVDYQAHLDDILVWGLVDQFNWLQNFSLAQRDDGLEVRGAFYASDYAPKPVREAVAEVLASQ